MLSDYNYLRNTVLSSVYTSQFSCDLSCLSYCVKAQLTKKFVPITHPDLMPGNFIVSLEDNRLIFYNVIAILPANSGVSIVDQHNYIEVLYMYGAQKNLQCKCPYLYQDFLYKISLSDIRYIIESISPTSEENGESSTNSTSDQIKRQVNFPNFIIPVSGDQFNIRTPYQEGPERQNSMRTSKGIRRMPSILKNTLSQEDIIRQTTPAKPKKQTNWLIGILTCCMVE